jgi:ribosomal protein L40E
MKNNRCIVCNTKISRYAKRCIICRNRYIAETYNKGIPRTKEVKEKLRKKAMKRIPPRIGAILSEKTKKSISDSLKRYYLTHNSCLIGKNLTLEQKNNISKKAKERLIIPENNPAYIDGRTLEKYYCKCGKEISYKADICRKCLYNELKYKFLNEGNPNWRGGISNLPYPDEFNDELREYIRKRDEYTCQICGIKQNQLKGFHKHLSIHHIDYNKQNCNEDNLISLCESCHFKTNGKREYWYAKLKK